MRTRCKDGDIAMIVGDHEGLDGNLGRFVRVLGSPICDNAMGIIWEFEPVGVNEWHADGWLLRRHPFSLVHPDRWMIPVSRARGNSLAEAERGGRSP